MKEGWRYYNSKDWIEIMAIRGKYVMARRKGCMPFIDDKAGIERKLFDGLYFFRPSPNARSNQG